MARSAKWKQRRAARSASNEAQQDAGGGYTSVRSAYEHVGPSQFYAEHGEEYSNPHGAVLTSLLQQALSSWASSGLLGLESCSHGCGSGGSSRPWRVLDLACGGGEASLALEEWWSRCSTSTKGCQPSGGPKRDESMRLEIEACDPYTAALYCRKTGRQAETWSFEELAAGVLVADGRPPFDLVLASFCLHLLSPEQLCQTLGALAKSSRLLLVATPHKRGLVTIEEHLGWRPLAEPLTAIDRTNEGATRHRVRVQLYRMQAL